MKYIFWLVHFTFIIIYTFNLFTNSLYFRINFTFSKMYNIYLFIFCVQISISSAGTRPYLRSDTPSSILSSDSDIRFTRKLGNQYRCSCYIASGFLVFLLLAGLTVYITCKYLNFILHFYLFLFSYIIY